jgi:hypothetical protein
MSMWEAPPQRKKSTVDFAGFASVDAGMAGPVDALTPRPKPSDASPMVEAVRKVRRSTEDRKSGVFMVVASLYIRGAMAELS